MTEWHETFFDALAHDVWRALVPAATSDDEADFLGRALALGARPQRATLLDVPCGDGRLAVRMARLGHRVVGVDISLTAVQRLNGEAAAQGVPVEARLEDMSRLGRVLDDTRFDGAWCMGNSFGYLDPAATSAFVAGVAGVLKPGGRFVIDAAMAAESVLPHLGHGGRYVAGDVVLTTVDRYDAPNSAIVTTMTLERGGERSQRVVRHRVMTCREIAALLDHAGFDVVDIDGGICGEPFVVGADRCLITAQRR